MKSRNGHSAASILLLLFIQTPAFGSIPLNVDVARFKAEDGWNYVEVYFSVPRDRLGHRRVGDVFAARFTLRIELTAGDSTVVEDTWENVDRVDSLGAITRSQVINDQASLFLREGDYRLKAVIEVTASGATGEYESELPIHPFPRNTFSASDIQLALRIVRSTGEGKFIKNGFNILPNPQSVYTMEWPVLYYYCELYNLSPLQSAGDSTYVVQAVIRDAQANVVRTMPAKRGVRSGSSIVEVGSAVVANLPSGSYSIGLDIIDAAIPDTVSLYKPFLVYRPGDLAVGSSMGEAGGDDFSQFAMMTEDELDQLFEKSEYIAQREDKRTYRQLNLEGKRRFMKTFWDRRDRSSMVTNGFLQEYLRRIAFVDRSYAAQNKPGWKTDRGRVYLIYGEPDQITRYPSNMGAKPYQIWSYHRIESGIEFVFVDRTGFGDMILVHSTARNEIHDYEWREKYLY